jgi:hypothetical protein
MFQTLIASVTVGAGGAASIEFTGIPQSFTDLTVLMSFRGATNNGSFGEWQFNGQTTTFTGRVLFGDGSSASSLQRTNGGQIAVPDGWTASTFSNVQMLIPNYTGSAAKSYSLDTVTERNATSADSTLHAGSWNGTAAITSLRFNYFGANLAQYSTAYLYGTLKGSGGASVS